MLNWVDTVKQWVVSWQWSWVGRQILARPFVRHVSVLTVANGISAAISLASGLLVVRWLGPELYGVAALVMSLPSLVYIFFDARSSEASVRYLSQFHVRQEREQAVAVCWLGYAIDIGVAAVAFLVVVVLAPWASQAVVHRPETAWLMLLYGAAFLPRALVGTSYAVLASLGRFATIALLTIVEAAIRASLVMSLVLAGLGVSGVIWGNAIAMTMTGALYCLPAILLIRRTWGVLSWMSAWRVLKVDRREIARFLAYDNLNALVGMIPKQLDLVLLGYFRNPAEVGYYKLAQSLAGTVGYLVSPLQSVTYPELSRLWIAGAWTAMRVKLRYLVLWIGVPAGLGVVTGSLLLFWVIPALTGEAYRPAIGAAQILLGGSAIWLGFFWLRPVYFAQGNIRQWLLISTKVALLSLVVYPLIIKQWGYLGLAVWSAMMQLLAHCLAGFYIWRELIK